MSAVPASRRNFLLVALPEGVQQRLAPKLKLVDMPLGKVLYEPGGKLHRVYFPTESIVSLLYVTEDGASAEIAIVGNDGIVGEALFMGGEFMPSRAVAQSAGHAFQLPAPALMAEFNRHEELHHLLLRYTQTLITQMAQTAVCNRHHTIDQQLYRWLLISLDRLPDNRLVMTQDLIANMLGVRREGVTEAAGKLRSLGVIEYHRGHITVLDRPRLERLCCECYAVVKKESDRLLAQSPRCPVAHRPNATPRVMTSEAVDQAWLMLDALPFPVTRIGLDYRLLASNKAAVEAYGSTPGMCFQVSHGHDRPCDQHREHCPKLAAETSSGPLSVLHVHQVGDRVLRAFAAILHSTVREADIAVRSGGEEFLIVLLGDDLAAAEQFTRRLLKETRELRLPIEGNVARVTVSAGIRYVRPDEVQSMGFDQAVKDADDALYHIKQTGRDRLHVHSS